MSRTQINHDGGFIHYDPPKFGHAGESIAVEESDAAMEELIKAEEERKRRTDDNSAIFWS